METPIEVKIPNFEVEKIGIKLIKKYSKNSKKHPQEQIDIIKTSITEFGFRNPILLNNFNDKEIVAGHGRLEAAIELGMGEVPCISAEDLTENQIIGFRIMDNKSAESSFDNDFLKVDMLKLKDEDYDLEFTGFNDEEIEDIFSDTDIEETEETTKEEAAEELVEELGKLTIKCPKCGVKFEKKDGKIPK